MSLNFEGNKHETSFDQKQICNRKLKFLSAGLAICTGRTHWRIALTSATLRANIAFRWYPMLLIRMELPCRVASSTGRIGTTNRFSGRRWKATRRASRFGMDYEVLWTWDRFPGQGNHSTSIHAFWIMADARIFAFSEQNPMFALVQTNRTDVIAVVSFNRITYILFFFDCVVFLECMSNFFFSTRNRTSCARPLRRESRFNSGPANIWPG